MVMRQVRIAELKARLSEYLRAVRGGETPIAQIVPAREPRGLRIRKPARGVPAPNKVRLPGPAAIDLDIVDLLLEERQGSR